MIIELLHKITRSLEQKNIPYMLSGSLALNAYTIPRMSLDIDIVIELQDEGIKDFFDIFKDNFYINKNTVESERKKFGMFNVIDQESGFKIDFIIKKESEYRKLEFSRRRQEIISGVKVWLVSPEDLVISKLDWIQRLYSEKQIADIKNLLKLSNIDMKYILFWINKLNIKTFNLF